VPSVTTRSWRKTVDADWNRVERAAYQAKNQLEQATTEEQFQAIGLLCRETLISLAQVVFNPNLHSSIDGVTASQTDAKRMLEAYLQYELQGSTHEAARKFAKSALDLANALQHRRTASFRDAALCVEATNAVVRVVMLVSGRLELASHEAPYRKVQSLLPELIAEMSADLKSNPLVREFFVVSERWVMNYPDSCFAYYLEKHENLQGKIHILENHGFVVDITTSTAKKYRIMEDFAEYLLSLKE
jgi:hypothetical protein